MSYYFTRTRVDGYLRKPTHSIPVPIMIIVVLTLWCHEGMNGQVIKVCSQKFNLWGVLFGGLFLLFYMNYKETVL